MGRRDILRAIDPNRDARDQRTWRIAEKWRGLSAAEQIALSGTAAVLAGGTLLLGAKLGAKLRAKVPGRAEMRVMETSQLLKLHTDGNPAQKNAVVSFCFCRVHELRGFLLEEETENAARQILLGVCETLRRNSDAPIAWRTARISFLKSALKDAPPFAPDVAAFGMSLADQETKSEQRERARLSAHRCSTEPSGNGTREVCSIWAICFMMRRVSTRPSENGTPRM